MFAKEIEYLDPFFYLPKNQDRNIVFLDSCAHHGFNWPQGTGLYSLIGVDPCHTILTQHNQTWMDGVKTGSNPFVILEKILKERKSLTTRLGCPFQGGVMGYWGYNLASFLEDIPNSQIDGSSFPQGIWGVFETVLVFDHHSKKAWIFSQTQWQLDQAYEFFQFKSLPYKDLPMFPKLQCNFSKSEYLRTLEKVIAYIYEGDIFQANLSRRLSLTLPAEVSLLHLYQKQRLLNPSPFSGFLKFGDTALLSSSPERFLKLSEGGRVETRPMKGTRPRTGRFDHDEKAQEELRTSPKDQAENLMIVDLLRNDLSKVCKPHSVKVPILFNIEEYPTVYQMVSAVEGDLKPGLGALDLLKACFPGGSITGAPKIRSMEILNELEPTVRGAYCGAMGYMGFNGSMDTSILIRTLAIQGDQLSFQVGGGITARSIPELEYDETEAKAKAFYRLLGQR